MSEPEPETTVVPVVAPMPHSAPPAASPRLRFLAEIVGPRIQSLATRLELAGHETLTDDRLGTEEPAIRFRLTPRQGPFDEAGGSGGAVLEVAAVSGGQEIVGRIWLDALSERPTEEISTERAQISLEWLDRLLFDFVEKTLRRS